VELSKNQEPHCQTYYQPSRQTSTATRRREPISVETRVEEKLKEALEADSIEFELVTDHKPLEAIFRPSSGGTTPQTTAYDQT
jgi:hypothetical protein